MKQIMLLIACVAMFIQVNAQKVMDGDVPQSTMTAFKDANPNATNVSWWKDGSNYAVKYESEKSKMFSTYSEAGKLVEHGWEIENSALPAKAREYVATNHKGDEIKKACKVTDANGKEMYKAEVKGNELWFDSNGNYVSSTAKK